MHFKQVHVMRASVRSGQRLPPQHGWSQERGLVCLEYQVRRDAIGRITGCILQSGEAYASVPTTPWRRHREVLRRSGVT